MVIFFKTSWMKYLQIIINVKLLKFHGFREKSGKFLKGLRSRLADRAVGEMFLSVWDDRTDLREGVRRTSPISAVKISGYPLGWTAVGPESASKSLAEL